MFAQVSETNGEAAFVQFLSEWSRAGRLGAGDTTTESLATCATRLRSEKDLVYLSSLRKLRSEDIAALVRYAASLTAQN